MFASVLFTSTVIRRGLNSLTRRACRSHRGGTNFWLANRFVAVTLIHFKARILAICAIGAWINGTIFLFTHFLLATAWFCYFFHHPLTATASRRCDNWAWFWFAKGIGLTSTMVFRENRHFTSFIASWWSKRWWAPWINTHLFSAPTIVIYIFQLLACCTIGRRIVLALVSCAGLCLASTFIGSCFHVVTFFAFWHLNSWALIAHALGEI